MVASSHNIPRAQLGRVLRERFIDEAQAGMPGIVQLVQERLTTLLDEVVNARESQSRRDAWMAYREAKITWERSAIAAWRQGLVQVPAKPAASSAIDFDMSSLQLVDAGVMDTKILVSRMVQGLTEKLHSEMDDLKVRIKLLEHTDELASTDVLRIDNYVQVLVEAWANAGLSVEAWPMVSEVVQRAVQQLLKAAYTNANALLVAHGILPVIELKDRVRGPIRTSALMPHPSVPAQSADSAPMPPSGFQRGPDSGAGDSGPVPASGPGTFAGTGPGSGPNSGPVPHESPGAPRRAGAFGGRLGWGSPAPAPAATDSGWRRTETVPHGDTAPPAPRQPGWASRPQAAAEETRMMTASSPLARAQQRAQGVAGQMRRIFVDQTGQDNATGGASHGARGAGPSPALAQAIAQHAVAANYSETAYDSHTPQGVVRVATDLRAKTSALKEKASTKGEKATIEIVALMFQAILTEERIPPGIRVWFARLQMPVLRTALEDPDFFGTTDHPARVLIDRMGSCVMGFEGNGAHSAAMEKEIKRIVQVVEQYPETGKKVYQIVYGEFQKFLGRFLTEKSETQRVVSVAQQVEQKETLAIQYTIEMRNMLRDMPVRDEIRDFLFKVWAEVMAVCALRKGPKHVDTQSLKKCATDLVWSASAKPNREDRARVIQDLPNLLLRLRSGMTLLGMLPEEQEAQVKKISDTLADAFMSKTQAIAPDMIDAMAKRLGELEDFVSEDGLGDLPLDAQSIEMMLGIESSEIEVVANGGSKPTAAMVAWAQELEIGSWFTLDHNNQVTQVQYAWRSNGGQLNLFAAATGKTYLLQTGRMAAYLQAGLLLPQEEEALTVRATRDALAKLEANPERLLS